jgi:[ribosomal protein S5]-alanine N-acetyltransferase
VIPMQTPRTIIRPYAESDVESVLPIFTDPITMSFWERPLDEDAIAAWVARNARSFRETGLGRMLVELRGSGETIGDCGIVRAEVAGCEENDLGYIIHHPYWRRGLGMECARACLEYGLRNLGLRRVVANMPHDHVASARVAEKLGMRLERDFDNPRNRNIRTHLYALEAGRDL